MARMGRLGLTDGQKIELWKRWRNGESLSDIGRAMGKHAGLFSGWWRVVASLQLYDNAPGQR